MKRSIISLAAAFLAFFQISANAQDTTVNPPSKESVDSVSYLLGISFASIIRGNSFGEIHEDAMLRGMHDFLKAEGSPGREGFDDQFEIAPSKMNDILNSYLSRRHQYVKSRNAAVEEKFLREHASTPGFHTTQTGLQYKIVKEGNSNHPQYYDKVLVKYAGYFIDGRIFDRSDTPVEFSTNRVIEGWAEGLSMIGEGGVIELVIPSSRAYGEGGNQVIEPNTPLLFTIELLKVTKSGD